MEPSLVPTFCWKSLVSSRQPRRMRLVSLGGFHHFQHNSLLSKSKLSKRSANSTRFDTGLRDVKKKSATRCFFGAEISFYLLSCTSSWRELKSSTLNQLYRADNHFTRSSNRFSLLCIGSTTRSTSVHLDFLNLLHIFVLAAFFRICLTMSAFALCKSTSEGVVQETVDFVPKIPNMFECKAQLVHSEP